MGLLHLCRCTRHTCAQMMAPARVPAVWVSRRASTTTTTTTTSNNDNDTTSGSRTGSTQLITKLGAISPLRDVPMSIRRPAYINQGVFCGLREALSGVSQEVEIKDAQQIQGMREACKLARLVLNTASQLVAPGVMTDQIDKLVHETCIQHGAYPSPLLYRDFPKSVCTSVNNVACHGIPDDRPLQNGDIVNIDVTVFYHGFHGDVSDTYVVGEAADQLVDLVNITRDSCDMALAQCGPGTPFNYIGHIIQFFANKSGLNIVERFCGHGIGNYFHGPPDIFHFANEEPGEMEAGMTFTIEPILTPGNGAIEILPDGWTAVTTDKSWTAQVEHTVLITKEGYEVLTR